jgi:hypothetical protein
VPGQGEAQRGGTNGLSAPEQNGNSVSGRVGDGATEGARRGGPGLGTITTIRTPYNEVLGKYTEQATQALERAYVPPDAKEYVRDYFTALGK